MKFPMTPTYGSKVFISYSRKNSEWKERLLKQLDVFAKHGLLDAWHDVKDVEAGDIWERELAEAIRTCRMAIVLLCPDALGSKIVLDQEFPPLRERQLKEGLRVIPVICKEPCDWKSHDLVSKSQVRPLSFGKPQVPVALRDMASAEADRALRALATEIAEQLSRAALAELPRLDQSLPPDRVYLDKFPLTRTTGPREEKLIGREQELALLDLAFAQPRTAIVSLVAWGGVGKTMLVQQWLHRLQREGWFGARRVYAWSFYSQGTKEDRQASEDTFLAHALEWFGVQCEPTLSPWDKGRLLADAVARERTLLILDGIEPLQYPPGPMGGQLRATGQDESELRAPGVQSLLKQLARKASAENSALRTPHSALSGGLCLVTTRVWLADLAQYKRSEDNLAGTVLRVDLGNLTAEAGAALLHHAGAKRAGAAEIKADDAELLAASLEVDGHALTLNLLGRFLARAHGGDIRRRDLVKFEEADRKEQGGTTFKMLAAFENWFANEAEIEDRSLAILRLLGLFDRPADEGCMTALRNPAVIAGLTEPLFTLKQNASTGHTSEQPLSDKSWNAAVSFLADFGLVVTQADTDDSGRLLDCHPLIREHFAKQLSRKAPEAWRTAHHRLYEYLVNSTEDKPQPTLENLQPLYQAVAHGCQAALHQGARSLWDTRIVLLEEKYSSRKLGAFGADLGAAACFFKQPWKHLGCSLPDDEQAWLFSDTAFTLRALGRFIEAIEPRRVSVKMAVDAADWKEAAINACNLSGLELAIGDVDSAVRDGDQSMDFADRSGLELWRLGSRSVLADALHQAGRVADAQARFREAETLQAERQPEFPLLYKWQGFAVL